MASKADFTPVEWQTLQWSVTDTMTYLSMADPGLWDTFKEAHGAAKYIEGMKTYSRNVLVRQLAADIGLHRDKAMSAGNVSGDAVGRVSEAVGLIANKAPEDLEPFKAFIIGVAQATAEAAKGIGPAEATAIAGLKAALG